MTRTSPRGREHGRFGLLFVIVLSVVAAALGNVVTEDHAATCSYISIVLAVIAVGMIIFTYTQHGYDQYPTGMDTCAPAAAYDAPASAYGVPADLTAAPSTAGPSFDSLFTLHPNAVI